MPRNKSDRRGQGASFLGSALTIIFTNGEGFSSAMQQFLAALCSNRPCDVLCLQETHRGSDNNDPTMHTWYGPRHWATTSSVWQCYFWQRKFCNRSYSFQTMTTLEILTVELSNVVITSVYKPPTTKFPEAVPRIHNKPQIIIGDLNSHIAPFGGPTPSHHSWHEATIIIP